MTGQAKPRQSRRRSGPFTVTVKRQVAPMKCDYGYAPSGKPCSRDATWEFSSEDELYCTQHAKMYGLEHGRCIEWGVSRRAVATLDGREVYNALYETQVRDKLGTSELIAALPDSGGKVIDGDGTVVTVAPVEWHVLTGMVFAPHGGLLVAHACAEGERQHVEYVIETYNAKESGRA